MERYRRIAIEGNWWIGTVCKNCDAPLLRFDQGFLVRVKLSVVVENSEITLCKNADLNELGMTIDIDAIRLGSMGFNAFLQDNDMVGIRHR